MCNEGKDGVLLHDLETSFCQDILFLSGFARLGWYHSPGFELQLQSCYNKPVVSIEELSTPVDPAVLDYPPGTIKEHMVNLLCHITSVGIPSPAMSLWALKS